MEIIMTLIVLIIIFSIGFLVGNKQLLKKEANGTIGSKPKTQTDYAREHKKVPPCVGHEFESQKEDETPAIDFMHNWIQEKSGKKQNPKQFNGIKTEEPFVKTRKRKPKTTKEWEDEFDLGGHE